MDFSTRIHKPEMIDFPERLSEVEMGRVSREMELVNRWLGGAEAALAPARRWISSQEGKRFRVLDVGAGSADIPRRLIGWAEGRGLELSVCALDFNLKACRIAQGPDLQAVQGNVLRLPFPPGTFDIVLCSAFLHHFKGDEAPRVLRSLRRAGRGLIVVNDLHRHPIAYWSFRILAALFSRSRAVKHDGPLSIRKGFCRRELERAFREAGMRGARVRWRRMFRWAATFTIE